MTAWQHIIGHEWAVQLLSGAIQHNRVGHAYLITGPDMIGKTTLARTFAQALNCSEVERPCGVCRTCNLIAKDKHPDVRLLQPEVSGRGKLSYKIDAFRQLQRDLNLAAYEANYKVAIIKRFDTANVNAANAFLKTLEEPPQNVILLLTANDADTVLPTIASRCRTVNLRQLPLSTIEQALQTRWQLPADDARFLAHVADGRLGYAIRAHQNPEGMQTRTQALDILYEALQGRRVGRFQLADKLARKPESLPAILQIWLSWWRDALLLAQGENKGLTVSNIDALETLQGWVAHWTKEQALTSLQHTSQALWQLERNANTRLVLENLLLYYPLPSRQ